MISFRWFGEWVPVSGDDVRAVVLEHKTWGGFRCPVDRTVYDLLMAGV